MSKRVFYGTSTSGSDEATKQVFLALTDEEKETLIQDDKIQFLEGDILNVTFAQENTATTVSLVIQLGQTEEETSTADDVGKFVKSLDVDFIGKGAWAAGETVGFCYVIHGTEDDTTGQAAYWAAVDAGVATGDIYGVTKLHPLDDSTDSFDDWWNGGVIDNSNDYSTAMTPATLKEFYNKFLKPVASEEEGETPAETGPGLIWEPVEQSETYSKLGDLRLSTSEDKVEIKIPSFIFDRTTTTHTGQLFNNGTGTPGNPFDEDAEPFITRYVPNNLYFDTHQPIGTDDPPTYENIGYGISAAGSGQAQNPVYDNEGHIWPSEDLFRYYLRFDPDYLILGYNGDDTFKGIKIRPKFYSDKGYITEAIVGDSDNNTLTAPTAITSYGDIIVPEWEYEEGQTTPRHGVESPVFYENGQPLHERYAPNFKILSFTTWGTSASPIKIPANANKTMGEARIFFNQTQRSDMSGRVYIGNKLEIGGVKYKPVGVVGYNIDYIKDVSQDSKDGRYVNVWEYFVMDDNNNNGEPGDIQVGFGNYRGSEVKVNITVWALCVAETSVFVPALKPKSDSSNSSETGSNTGSTEESGS